MLSIPLRTAHQAQSLLLLSLVECHRVVVNHLAWFVEGLILEPFWIGIQQVNKLLARNSLLLLLGLDGVSLQNRLIMRSDCLHSWLVAWIFWLQLLVVEFRIDQVCWLLVYNIWGSFLTLIFTSWLFSNELRFIRITISLLVAQLSIVEKLGLRWSWSLDLGTQMSFLLNTRFNIFSRLALENLLSLLM